MSPVLGGALLFGFCLASADFAAADEQSPDKTTAPDNAADTLQEIIVTAERRERIATGAGCSDGSHSG